MPCDLCKHTVELKHLVTIRRAMTIPGMSNRNRLSAAFCDISTSEPLVVAAAGEPRHVGREQAQVAVDEVLFAPSCSLLSDLEMMGNGLQVLLRKLGLAHSKKFEHDHAAIHLNCFQLATLDARLLPALEKRWKRSAFQTLRDDPVVADRPASVWLVLARVAHVDGHGEQALSGRCTVALSNVGNDTDVCVEIQDAILTPDDLGQKHLAVSTDVDRRVRKRQYVLRKPCTKGVVVDVCSDTLTVGPLYKFAMQRNGGHKMEM